jgi:hypothetical protein
MGWEEEFGVWGLVFGAADTRRGGAIIPKRNLGAAELGD